MAGNPTESEFIKLAANLRRLAGIYLPLNDKNMALMSNRLAKLKYDGIHNYRDLLSAIDNHNLRVTHLFVSAMTTNTTHFFREKEHFDFLAKVVREQIRARPRGSQQEYRLWCAASSTGEEPYALAMLLQDLKSQLDYSFRILATDIDYKALATAKTGIYSAKQMENVPPAYLEKFFTRSHDGEEVFYRVQEKLKDCVQFGRFNLLKNYPFKNKFDAVFCRNVLIYFEKDTVRYVIDHLTQVLQPGGYLFLGHSEAVAGMFPGLRRAGPAVYRWEP